MIASYTIQKKIRRSKISVAIVARYGPRVRNVIQNNLYNYRNKGGKEVEVSITNSLNKTRKKLLYNIKFKSQDKEANPKISQATITRTSPSPALKPKERDKK
jgi:hypothetical protein